MRVVLLGASGKVGRPILDELLQRGHHVTAVARNAARLPAERPGLTVTIGDIFNVTFRKHLRDLVDAAETLLCSVAMRDEAQRERADRSPVELVRIAADTAASAGARLFTMGGAGSLEVAPGVQLVDTPEFPEVAKAESLGFRDALVYLRKSAPEGLDWTMLSPPVSIEPGEPRTGRYRVGTDALVTDGQGRSRISAADLAVAVVDELERPQHLGTRFTVGY